MSPYAQSLGPTGDLIVFGIVLVFAIYGVVRMYRDWRCPSDLCPECNSPLGENTDTCDTCAGRGR